MWPICSGPTTLMRYLGRQLIKHARSSTTTSLKLRNKSDGGEVLFEVDTCFLYFVGTIRLDFNPAESDP